MNCSKLLRRFKNKLLCESILKSLLFAIMTGAVSVFCLSLVFHILQKEMITFLLLVVGVSAFVLGFVLRFILGFPTEKKTAKRIDEIGLEERTSTMVAYKNETSEIATIQRKDATEHIDNLAVKKLRFRFLKREWIPSIVSLCLAVTMLMLPLSVFSFGAGKDELDLEQQQAIKEFIQNLRDEIKESSLSEEIKEEINDIIDDLEEDLEETESELEQAAEIEQAKKKIDELLKSALTKDKIGEALQKYELTRKLGEAVSDGDTEKVSDEMDTLEENMKNSLEELFVLSENIISALNDSGVDSSDSLYSAFFDFANNLAEVDLESSEIENKIEKIFDEAKNAILEALEEQNKIEEEKEKIDDSMSEAKDEILGNEKEEDEEKGEGGESQEGENPDGEKPDGEAPDGEAPDGEAPDGEAPDGGGEGQGGEGDDIATMTEKIYDPISGNVEYGEVFAAYYAEYLAALEAGEVSEELQEIIDNYFASLN